MRITSKPTPIKLRKNTFKRAQCMLKMFRYVYVMLQPVVIMLICISFIAHTAAHNLWTGLRSKEI